MRWLWWSQLPLLMIIQLMEPSKLNQKAYVEALLAFKSAVVNPQQLRSLVGRPSCSRSRIGCMHKLKDAAAYSLLTGTPTQSETRKLLPAASTSSPSQTLTPIHINAYKSIKTRITATVGGDLGVTPPPSPSAIHEKPGVPKVAAIVSGCVGAVLLVAVSVLLVYICLMRAKRFVRRTSDTGSSAPTPVEWPRENGFPNASSLSADEIQSIRHLPFLELEHATSKFSEGNLIGEGGFGIVYKGLLQDGSMVAIKRRLQEPSQYFIQEVESIGSIRNNHLVKLIGFCQERHQQLLVYDYHPNRNVGSHLYDSEGLPVGKLDIWQRLSFAIRAAKGLEYLHSLTPPHLHMHFRTRNVLLDEKFVAKVSDFGVRKLMVEGNRAESSSSIDCFLDPELASGNGFSERSDVYSFGVFLLELISGREALHKSGLESAENLVIEAKGLRSLDGFVDKTLGEKITGATQYMTKLALQCVDTGVRRPTMKMVVEELELIQERERGHQGSDLGEEITLVTLGSDLFK